MSGFNPSKETRCNEFRRASRSTLVCDVSGDNIYAGDRYRELIIVEGGDFTRRVALVSAVQGKPEWEPFLLQEGDQAFADLREGGNHRWRLGATVQVLGLPAVIRGRTPTGELVLEQNGLTRTLPVDQVTPP